LRFWGETKDEDGEGIAQRGMMESRETKETTGMKTDLFFLDQLSF
jgi:hypothetical protein